MNKKKPSVDDIFQKYGKKLKEEIDSDEVVQENSEFSREYLTFKKDMMPALSRYEKLAQSLGGILKIKVAEKDKEKIQKQLETAHLDVTPGQALTLAFVSLVLSFFVGALISAAIFIVTGEFSLLFLFLVVLFSMFIFYYFYTFPARLANKWRLKASSQMVPCILYIVAYMKHTSNLERAIAFASQHLSPPLSLDLRKVFWDLETGKFSGIKESLDSYLKRWRQDSPEFVESFHLIESSLYESNEARRVQVLERALQVILDGVYEKMLGYTREIRSPLTNIYMLGIVLPTLGIALLPLASSLLQGMIKWYHVFVFFNLVIPFFVFYMTSQVLLKRPGGHGESELLELNPDYKKFKSKRYYWIAFFMVLPLLLIGISPFLFNTSLPAMIGLNSDYTFSEIGITMFKEMKLFDFKTVGGKTTGPFGLLAVILSLFIPFAAAMFFSIVYNFKTKELIKTRAKTKRLEDEFANSLFQLGNRLGGGTPAEIAFAHVAESTKGQTTEGFFRTVNLNIQQMGMSLEQAIFSKQRGALIYYPSSLISTSMKILVESVKKGLKVAARALMSISEYIRNIKKINERMRDLLAEVVSDMKSNMVFLAPLLSGIVVGLGTMISIILNKLQVLFESQGNVNVGGVGNIGTLLELFDITSMIPPYFLQIAIGIYIVEIIFILTSTLVTVDSGEDKLSVIYETGRNLRRGIILYSVVTLIAILALAILAGVALGGLG